MLKQSMMQPLQTKILSGILILICCDKHAIGSVTLSPMMIATVCRVGDPLQLTCTASVEFIRWSIFQANEQGTLVSVINSVQINSRDPYQMSERVVNSATFSFMRSSSEDSLPLVSTLSIDSVSIGLNGTVVRCSDIADPSILSSTTIQVIDINQIIDIQYVPVLSISEAYSIDHVTVTVEWAQQIGAMYNVRVSPPVPDLMVTGSTGRQLTVSYNTKYILHIEAVPPCKTDAIVSTNVTLNYAKCRHQDLLTTVSYCNDSIPKVVGYHDDLPILEGHTVNFNCPPGLALTGPDSATCMENGVWTHDPSWLKCRVTCDNLFNKTNTASSDFTITMDYIATEGTTVTFGCPAYYVLVGPNTTTCMGNGKWEPDPREVECKEKMAESKITESDVFTAAVSSSAAIAFLLISITIFVLGILCGHYCGRRLSKETPHVITGQVQAHQVPAYEGASLKAVPKKQEQGVELEDNVAYHPSKSTDIESYYQ